MSPVTSSRHSRPYDLTRVLYILGPITHLSSVLYLTKTFAVETSYLQPVLLLRVRSRTARHGSLHNGNMYDKMLDDCCMQLLIIMDIMDGERKHSMGSPMDGTPPQSEDQ